MEITLEGTRVLNLSHPVGLKPMETGYMHNEADHRELAMKLSADYKLSSVIVFNSRLRDDLWDNPKYAKKTTHILCSEIEERAREIMSNRYHHLEAAHEKLKERGVELDPGNSEDVDKNHRSLLTDMYYEAQNQLLYPELVARYKDEIKRPYDEEKEEDLPELSDEEVEERSSTRNLKLATCNGQRCCALWLGHLLLFCPGH